MGVKREWQNSGATGYWCEGGEQRKKGLGGGMHWLFHPREKKECTIAKSRGRESRRDIDRDCVRVCVIELVPVHRTHKDNIAEITYPTFDLS